MSIQNVEQLNDMHIDVLKEIGNIGSGNAASALAELLNCPTKINVPAVRILDFGDAVTYLGGPEKIAIGVLVNLSGDIKGMMLYVFQEAFASKMTGCLFGSKIENMMDLNEMEVSLISEVGNIMCASYINAISSLAGMRIDVSVPMLTADMVGAILSVPAIEFARTGNKVLFIDDSFIIDDSEIKSNMILIPEMASLNTLFGALGVGE